MCCDNCDDDDDDDTVLFFFGCLIEIGLETDVDNDNDTQKGV